MSELPTGTVTLLFSDIEGSTVLLSRLGSAYADALDGQRRVLRKAWAEHGGTELGTEGDSFYVVFSTAPDAVTAAAQAQQELADYEWPAGERVRVRMGIHTGNPTVYDGTYVGMDVHRAARIAASAHGGQVVLSQATAALAGADLPVGVTLRDLGSHRLKDIPRPERLFQLVIDGLPARFPALRAIGTASSLPSPATPLVGRDAELAGVTALIASGEAHLVTLTGTGGAGKTRLAFAAAQQLVEWCPDGVYLVSLVGATNSEVMWSSIGEVLDLPPQARERNGVIERLAHRSALLVLDNLEQLPDAASVVEELLGAAPLAAVIATSRRPLHVAGEHEYPLAPLDLPTGARLPEAEASSAVTLFVQCARRVDPTFELTADNAADVVAVCRRLDGLPLAIELVAARVKLLSPKALLARLDKALDIGTSGRRPARQRTLRDTIGWSYDLLDGTQKAFFRRLGVFAGGADLDAVDAVTGDILDGRDPLDLLSDVVDLSLATVSDSFVAGPRAALLETTRSFAMEQLHANGEADTSRQRHAEFYGHLVGVLRSMTSGPEYEVAVTRFDQELPNLREALTWALQPPSDAGPEQLRLKLGLALAADFGNLAISMGHLAEARARLEQAIGVAASEPTHAAAVAICQARLAAAFLEQGEQDRARHLARRALDASRRVGDEENIIRSLSVLAPAELQLGHSAVARSLLEEAVEQSRRSHRKAALSEALKKLFTLEVDEGNIQGAFERLAETRQLDEQLGAPWGVVWGGTALTSLLLRQGRIKEAAEQARRVTSDVVGFGEPGALMAFGELCASVLGLSQPEYAAELLGAVEAMREREQRPRPPSETKDLTSQLAAVRQLVSEQDWQRHYHVGRTKTVEELLVRATLKTDGG